MLITKQVSFGDYQLTDEDTGVKHRVFAGMGNIIDDVTKHGASLPPKHWGAVIGAIRKVRLDLESLEEPPLANLVRIDDSFILYDEAGRVKLELHISTLGNLVIKRSLRETVRIKPDEVKDFLTAVNDLGAKMCQN